MNNKFVHIVVSSMNMAQTKVKYRRHRLVDYLYKNQSTKDLIVVYPISTTLKKPQSYFKADEILHNNPCFNKCGYKEWALPDFVPGRYMQFKSSFGNSKFTKLKRFINNYDAKIILWYTYPAYPYLTNLINWDVIVYDCSDLWTEPSGGSRSNTFSAKTATGLICSAEKKIIDSSSIIFASSDFLAARIKKISGSEAVTVENGVDLFFFSDEGFTNIDGLEIIPRPRLGYVGALRSKVDFALLDKLADQNNDWSIVLIGPDCLNDKEVFQRLLQKNNVFWTGEVQEREIPGYIKSLDVGLLPYREIEYNKAVFPIKFYEYLSQGIPVVGCGIPSTKKYDEKGIYLHVERVKYMEACQKALSWTGTAEKDFTAKRIKLAREAGWEKKLDQMLEKVKEQLKR